MVEKATLDTNIAFDRAIGTSPYILKWSKSPELEIDKEFSLPTHRLNKDSLINKRNQNFEKYKKSIQKGNIVAKSDFSIKDRVLIFRENNSNKLKENWHEGFVITDRILPDAFIVRNGKRFLRVNKSHVKLDTSF